MDKEPFLKLKMEINMLMISTVFVIQIKSCQNKFSQ